MKKLLLDLGLSAKEADVYLALLEYGLQPASVLARKTAFPKSTVLFLLEELLKRGFIRKSQRGRTQYFWADIADFEAVQQRELQRKQQSLAQALPLMKEFKHPYSSEPKVTFFEGISGCKKAYLLLLESQTEILEFGVHADLAGKFGTDFMNDFIKKRVKNKVQLRAISNKDEISKKLIKNNKKQLRQIQFYDDSKGQLYSSIAIFENKVLLLNLFQDAFAILIENNEVAETLKTIFKISWH